MILHGDHSLEYCECAHHARALFSILILTSTLSTILRSIQSPTRRAHDRRSRWVAHLVLAKAACSINSPLYYALTIPSHLRTQSVSLSATRPHPPLPSRNSHCIPVGHYSSASNILLASSPSNLSHNYILNQPFQLPIHTREVRLSGAQFASHRVRIAPLWPHLSVAGQVCGRAFPDFQGRTTIRCW